MQAGGRESEVGVWRVLPSVRIEPIRRGVGKRFDGLGGAVTANGPIADNSRTEYLGLRPGVTWRQILVEVLSTRPIGSNRHQLQKPRDFVVSGTSLFMTFSNLGFDEVPCLGWLVSAEDDAARRRLLGEVDPDLPSGHVSLFICPLCGDLGCGAIGVKILKQRNFVIWSQFAFENDYDPESYEAISQVGPFEFDYGQYKSAILDGVI